MSETVGTGASSGAAHEPWAAGPVGAPPGGQPAPVGPGAVPRGPRGGFWARFGAFLIDTILVAIVYFILLRLLGGVGYALALIFNIAYFTYLEGGASGQTLGKQALGLRVVDSRTAGPIGYGRGFIRWIGRIVSAIPIYLGYFWMLWDKDKQAWHDKLASDVVVPVSAYPVERIR